MQWFNDLRLRAKLLLSFGVLTAMLGTVGYIGVTNLNLSRAVTQQIVDGEMGAVVAATDILVGLRTVQRDMRQSVLVTGKENATWEPSLGKALAGITDSVTTLDGLLVVPEGKAKLQLVRDALEQWRPTREAVMALAKNDKNDEAIEIMMSPANVAAIAGVNAAVDDLLAFKRQRAKDQSEAADAATAAAANLLIASVLGGVVISLAIAFFLSRRISASMAITNQRLMQLSANCLTGLQRGMVAMSRGDLSVDVVPTTLPLEVQSKDEFGELAQVFNGALTMTKGTIESYSNAQKVIQGVIAESSRLVEAGRNGELDVRGDAKKFDGVFHGLVQGMNDLLEAVVLPMNEASDVLQGMAKGDLTTEMCGEYAGDHDRLKVALNSAIQEMQRTIGLISTNAQTLASSAEELSAVATQMGGNAEETSAQAGVVSQASSQVSKSVQTVAVGTEEMSSSIRDIAKNASEAARVASQAVAAADETNTIVTKLGTSSQEIGQVIKVITSIAQQTNLLALNATIEAARAGEAGKGFAVVANEVKELAKQTAGATEDISRRIEAIRGDTQQAVEAIRNIGGVISQINDIQIAIASAVEEQTATTNEMGRNAAEAARGSEDIASNIVGVAKAAEQTSSGAQNSQQAAQELARMAAELQQLVGKFQFEAGVRHEAPPTRAANGRGRPGARRAA